MKLNVKSQLERPIVFRTVGSDVYQSTIETGSVWLRSSHYYREIEDEARKDQSEGYNSTTTPFPLHFAPEGAAPITIRGDGSVGQHINPHYIMSLHGTGLSEHMRQDFGGYTIGVCCFWRLAAEIFVEASKQLELTGYRYGQVSYQRTALIMSSSGGGAAITLGGDSPVHIKSINTDVLRKDPVEPFIFQDEWRIALFPKNYLNEDPKEPLRLNVDPSNFYEYIHPEKNKA